MVLYYKEISEEDRKLKNRTAQKNKYQSEAYDQVRYLVPQGKKEILKAAAARRGVSVNAYINAAVDAALAKDAERLQ